MVKIVNQEMCCCFCISDCIPFKTHTLVDSLGNKDFFSLGKRWAKRTRLGSGVK